MKGFKKLLYCIYQPRPGLFVWLFSIFFHPGAWFLTDSWMFWLNNLVALHWWKRRFKTIKSIKVKFLNFYMALSMLVQNLHSYYKLMLLKESFFFSDFKFSTQFVSTLCVAWIILFEVSWPRYSSILLQRWSHFNINCRIIVIGHTSWFVFSFV